MYEKAEKTLKMDGKWTKMKEYKIVNVDKVDTYERRDNKQQFFFHQKTFANHTYLKKGGLISFRTHSRVGWGETQNK